MSDASATLSPARSRTAPSRVRCIRCGSRKVLRFTVRRSGVEPDCLVCKAQRERSRRAAVSVAKYRGLVGKALARDALRVSQVLSSLIRACGGFEGLARRLAGEPGTAAELIVKLSAAQAELDKRAAEQSRAALAQRSAGRAAARAGARDAATVAACVEVLAELQPVELRPVLERLTLRARTNRARQLLGDGDGI